MDEHVRILRMHRVRLASIKWYMTHNKRVPSFLWSNRAYAR